MLSGKLVHLIEANSDQIVTRIIRHIRQDPEMSHYQILSDAELREWGQDILENLGKWLTGGHEEEWARRYEELGRLRYRQSIPLCEAVHGLLMLKEKMTDFVQDQALTKTSVQLYAEEELEHQVGRFFHFLVCHLVSGYEGAMRKAARVGA